MKKELEYGNVIVTGGEHEGKVGYFDNLEGDLCVVYLGVPFLESETLIEEKYLENTELSSIGMDAYEDVKVMCVGLNAMDRLSKKGIDIEKLIKTSRAIKLWSLKI